MSLIKAFLWISMLAYSSQSVACDLHGKTGIIEDNDLYIPADSKNVGGITKVQFNNVIDKVKETYEWVANSYGKELLFERKWMDGTVNAYAKQIENTWIISMFGGLARHEAITEDGFTLVVCHELGHHLGGAPRKLRNRKIIWASNEGQSDYWATMKCLRNVWAQEDNLKAIEGLVIDDIVKKKCDEVYSTPETKAICYRASLAGKSVASLFGSMTVNEAVDFNKPDDMVVELTFDGHPIPQCRLDTYFRASLCDTPSYVQVSKDDAAVGTCTRDDGQEIGSRPRCWYYPQATTPI